MMKFGGSTRLVILQGPSEVCTTNQIYRKGAFFQFPKIDTFVNFHGALLASLMVIS